MRLPYHNVKRPTLSPIFVKLNILYSDINQAGKSALMSLGDERKAFCTMNQKLTITILTALRSICRQLSQQRITANLRVKQQLSPQPQNRCLRLCEK